MQNTLDLVAGLPRRELLAAIRTHHRQGELAERALGFYLLDMERRKAFLPGHASAGDWARRNLDLRRADKLILLAKRLEELPRIRGAFDDGTLPWTKAREIARISTPETEESWLALARKATSRELERAIEGTKRGDKPGGGLKARVRKYIELLRLTGAQKAIWDQAIRKLMGELRKGTTPLEAAVEMARRALEAKPEGEEKENDKEAGEGAGKRTRRPAGWCTVVFHRKSDGSTWVDTPEGPLPVEPEELVRRIREGARLLEVRDLEGAGECPAIELGERGRVAKEDRDPPVSRELRDAVFARDGYRCLICGSTEDLTNHHFDSHAHGGKGTMSRMGCLCRSCQGACHRGDILLRIDEEGRVTALDRDGEVLACFGPLPTVPGEVQRVVVRDAPGAPEEERAVEERGVVAASPGSARGEPGASGALEPGESPGCPRPFASLEDLPREISVVEWRRLQACLEWSPSQRAFIFRPDADLAEALSGASAVAEPAPSRAGDAATTGSPGTASGSPVRPGAIEDFVGQARVVGNLLLAARAAKARGEVLGHVLLSGPPGLGKTTLARLLARECGAGIQEVVAGSIGDPWQLVALLAGLEKGSVLFIDEVHRLDAAGEEALYSALEDGTVDVVVREGSRSRILRLRLAAFTVVGATTRAGALSEPFRARFRHRERLEPYSEAELAEIIARASTRLGTPASPEAALEIARRSRGAPREAVRLLELARDVVQVEGPARDADAGVAHVGHAEAEMPGNPGSGEGLVSGTDGPDAEVLEAAGLGDASVAHVDPVDARLPGIPGFGEDSVAHVGHGISTEHVLQAAERLGLDERGLDRVEQTIVRFLARIGRPIGAEALASRLGVDLETFRDVHEPWLERAGLVERTERGRLATPEAREIYGPGSASDAVRRMPASAGPGARPRGLPVIPILRVPFRR